MRLIFMSVIAMGFIAACSIKPTNKLDLPSLSSHVGDHTIKQLKYKVETDLQFDKGCRGKGVAIESCDFSNTLSVKFQHFDCVRNRSEELGPKTYLAWRANSGVNCEFDGVIIWPDGSREPFPETSATYRLEYYSDGLSHEYVWNQVS